MIKNSIKLTVSMAIFGSIGFFTIQTGIPALELVFVRCIFATVFLLLLWLLIGGHRTEQWHRQDIGRTIVCGIFLVLNWLFLFKAFEQMAISVAISIYNIAPIFVLLLGAIFLRERLSVQAIAATTVCFFGSVLIVGSDGATELVATEGVAWAFLSALCYALTMFTSRTIQHLSSYALTFIQTAVGIVMLLPFCDFMHFAHLTATNWIFIVATGLIHTGFVYYLFFDSIRHLPAMLVSVLVFVDPLVAIALDIVILSFVPSAAQIIGMVLIFMTIFYIAFLPRRVST